MRDRDRLKNAMLAIDRLNNWIRSPSAQGRAPARYIYWLKRKAIAELDRLGLCEHRRVVCPVKCRDCGGSGRYVDSWGYRHDHCWACGNCGTAVLTFIESRLLCGPTWHTPWQRSWEMDLARASSNAIRRLLPMATDWRPLQQGIDRTPAEVAEDLCIAEEAYPEPMPPRYDNDDREYHDDRYRLWVGRIEGACSLCGDSVPDDGARTYCCSREQIAWDDTACKACVEHYEWIGERNRSQTTLIFGAFPLPDSLIADARIKRWMYRHRRSS